MFILHVALQGCLGSQDIRYGITADTGGHIRYLLELVNEAVQTPGAGRIVVATRRFDSSYGEEFAGSGQVLPNGVEILRLSSLTPAYVAKEEMGPEVPAFADALIDWIRRQPVRPDLLHAHYADAGSVAALVKARLGIPFVFTAHSLGRVKAGLPGTVPDASLAARIAAEERAIAAASLIIASSRDEAEVQYAGYGAYEPGRIRIVPPGSDLAAYAGGTSSVEVDEAIGRFLREPDKPVILAIARPVAKKNLAGLVRAFGESPALQARANLVVVAGTRDDLDDLDEEMAATLRELLELVDHYDLYGRVAYPKTHRPEDIPAVYAHARARRGIFVNPALNEPFGLTLLEAAAAGLPLVATDSGGPNDIIEMCRNGELVNPTSSDAIATACLKILDDAELWSRYAAAGSQAVSAYDWTRHVARYHELLGSLISAGRKSTRKASKPRQLLVCDIDNTLVGCADAILSFGAWHETQDGLAFGVATGRSFHSAMAILEQQKTPRPQVLITSVGSEIYHLDPNGTTYTADADWRRVVAKDWSREGVLKALAVLPDLVPQAPLEQRAFKLSFLTEGGHDVVRRVHVALTFAGLACSVIHSHGRYLDILPIGASKGTAVDYVRRRLALPESAVFVAGDSGNDIEMLRTVRQAIIVGNFSDDLASLPALRHSYVARQTFAHGIIEGVDHFRRKAALSA